MFFVFTGLSTGIGAINHGFRFMIQPDVFHIMWMAMNIFCSISVYFALTATIRFTRADPNIHRIFQIINLIALLAFISLTIINNDFEIFKIHAGIGLFLIWITHIVAYFKSHVAGSGSVVLGMLLSFLTVYVHSKQISINEWFDHKDISHVIMMISLIMVYNGIYLMQKSIKLSVQRMRYVQLKNLDL